MTWPEQKASLRRARPEARERRLLDAFRQLSVEGQVIAVAYVEECQSAEQQRADKERAR